MLALTTTSKGTGLMFAAGRCRSHKTADVLTYTGNPHRYDHAI